ncbi:MAG: hypothetical protein KatS3mg131_2120 [Candidatus Tectimicrobiota bacterium]|nr:MAG: hypothetical protein KatS3mg131_2120 [Candidatus Tectomicrobia bacterium]
MLKQLLEIYELLDSPRASGEAVAALLTARGLDAVEVQPVAGEAGKTDFVKVLVPGAAGKSAGGQAPTLGIIGRLGGIGARPAVRGMVSDADGALAALTCALKLADMRRQGEVLAGDVRIATHICPAAPIRPHDPVPFMMSPVEMAVMNRYEVDAAMEAILSVDATKGNRILNRRGIAITPTVKEGYILRVAEDLLTILQQVTGQLPVVLPLTTQDITPYGNGLYHLNSIVQPAVATDAPVVGVATTAEVPVAGCATGANQLEDVAAAARFCLEVAKAFGEGRCQFYDAEEFARLVRRYGSMKHLQTLGQEA